MISTLRSFKKSSSAGVSGIRPGHILSLLDIQGSNRLVHTLRSLTSKLANFEVPQCLSPLLCGARLIALRKPNGDPRPIACGDVFRRLTSKLVLLRALPLVSPKLLPVQLGISVPSGTEMIFHQVCSQLNTTLDEQNLLLLDLKNAFNSIDRSSIMKAITKYCPLLLRWFAWSYGVPSRLNFGEFTIMSKQGVQQGDPLGSLLFAIAIHDSIMAVHSLHGVVWSGWFADDGTIQAPYLTSCS